MTKINSLFTVKCFSPSQIIFTCKTESWVEAVFAAHVLAETYEHCAGVYKPGETTPAYTASGKPDITQRVCT